MVADSFSAGPDTLVARADNLVSSRVDDSIIAINRDLGYCFAMNVTGARVWELISSPIRVGSVRDALCDEFLVDRDTCLRDVLAILSQMRENGLLRESGLPR
jgi:hypothetical protein